jgi:hypothetical protein
MVDPCHDSLQHMTASRCGHTEATSSISGCAGWRPHAPASPVILPGDELVMNFTASAATSSVTTLLRRLVTGSANEMSLAPGDLRASKVRFWEAHSCCTQAGGPDGTLL